MTNVGAALVVGANRRIGHQLVRTFESRGWTTLGTVRPQTLADNDTSITDLRATESTILELDYKDEDTIKKAAAALHQKGITLDVLVHCGGIMVGPKEWDAHEQDDLMERFNVMVVAPSRDQAFPAAHHKDGTGRIIYVTSLSGSIGDPGHDGEVIGYRMAKSAANQQVKTLALDFQRDKIPVSTLAFESGFIKTRLTGWKGTRRHC